MIAKALVHDDKPSDKPNDKPRSKRERDPFVSVIQPRGTQSPICTGERKCLAVEEMTLKGVVHGPGGVLAVVENERHTAYFLREKDPVFNGQVLHIGANSITVREKVLDKLGHEQTREVVKMIAGRKPGA